jgi:cold shock protein
MQGTGIVTHYNEERGYGWIKASDGSSLFVHISDVRLDGPNRFLMKGDRLSFDITRTDKGLKAVNLYASNHVRMMQHRWEAHEITCANIALINVGDGRVAAGVQLSKREPTENGGFYHIPYFIMSLIVEVPSVRQAIPLIAYQVIDHVSPETKLAKIIGNTAHFQQGRRLRDEIGIYAATRGIHVSFKHNAAIGRIVSDTALLANDALRRGDSILMPI